MKLKLLLLSAFISLAGAAHAQRIVVLTPDTADIVAALGALDEIVGRDQTVQNPALKNKPSIGIHRRLTVEPIVAAKPDIAIGSWMAQPADIFAHLQKAGIKAVNVAPDDSIAAYPQSIRNIGQLIGKSAQADKLASKWQADMKQQPSSGKRYLFSYDGDRQRQNLCRTPRNRRLACREKRQDLFVEGQRYVPLRTGYATSDSAFAWFGEINAPVLKILPDFCFQTASICSFLLRRQNGCLKNAV